MEGILFFLVLSQYFKQKHLQLTLTEHERATSAYYWMKGLDIWRFGWKRSTLKGIDKRINILYIDVIALVSNLTHNVLMLNSEVCFWPLPSGRVYVV